MEILPFDRVTVIIIRCSRQLMQEIGWGFLGKAGLRRDTGDGTDQVKARAAIFIAALAFLRVVFQKCHSTRLAWRVTWQPRLTQQGRPAMWVG